MNGWLKLKIPPQYSSPELKIRRGTTDRNNFPYYSFKMYVATLNSTIAETILMRGHNISFH